MSPSRVARLFLLAALAIHAPARGQDRATIALTGTIRIRPADRTPTVVYVTGPHPAPTGDTVEVDQLRLAFVPPVRLVAPGTVVRFLNSDPVVHSVFSPTGVTGPFDLGRYGPDEARNRTFVASGAALLLCRIHPEMAGHVLVADAARWTVTDTDGRFRLDDVPVDATELVVWHWRAGTRRVSLAGRPPGPLSITLP